MHILDVLIRMHILDVLLLLLLAKTVTAPLFGDFQPQSNNDAGSVVVPKATVLSLTTVLTVLAGESTLLIPEEKGRYGYSIINSDKQVGGIGTQSVGKRRLQLL